MALAREIVVTCLRDDVAAAFRSSAPQATTIVLDQERVSGSFDDIILLGPRSASIVSRASAALDFRGVMNLVGDEPLDGPVEIDVGRIHYHYTAYVGTRGPKVAEAYGEKRNRAELRRAAAHLFVGAAGPMGQMHLERALKIASGPATL